DLAERLNQLMLCVVCHEVPFPDKSYQCLIGHILCDDCVTHILADAAITEQEAQCPVCRIRMTWHDLSRNSVLRQALWELAKTCILCGNLVPLKEFTHHLEAECEHRQVSCQYRCLGCGWAGPFVKSSAHEEACEFPQKSCEEIAKELERADALRRSRQQQLLSFHHELGRSRIFFRNLELFWQRSETTFTESHLCSQNFDAYANQWMLRLRVTLSNEDIPQSMSTNLLLKSAPKEPLSLRYLVLMANPLGGEKRIQQDIRPKMVLRSFVAANLEGEFFELPLENRKAMYRILGMQNIVLRLWIFI
ncbi:hypothetical protein KR018_006564, partial [Drosophila ironensis]